MSQAIPDMLVTVSTERRYRTSNVPLCSILTAHSEIDKIKAPPALIPILLRHGLLADLSVLRCWWVFPPASRCLTLP